MAVYTLLSNDDIAAFMEPYGLGELAFAVGITQGVENSNYLVALHAPDGAEIKTILTLFEKRTAPEDLPFFVGLMEHVSAKGVPAPTPLKTMSGEVIRTIGGKSAIVVSFLEGRSRNALRNPLLAELGTELARLHLATEDFSMTRPNTLSLGGWQQLYEKIAPRLDEVAGGLADMVGKELAFLQAHWPQDLPRGVIHADVFPDNVFFEGDRLSGLIDFYFACEDAYMYDVAICLNAWCFETSGEFNLTKASLLLSRYAAVRPFSAAEKEALPLLVRGAALRFLLTRAHDWIFRQEGAQVVVKDPKEYLAKLRFFQREEWNM